MANELISLGGRTDTIEFPNLRTRLNCRYEADFWFTYTMPIIRTAKKQKVDHLP